MKRVVFALLPLAFLLTLVEAGARLAGSTNELIAPFTLPGETAGLLELDSDLFWRLRAGAEGELQGVRVRTNSLGLRGPEIAAKAAGQLRILSLGESTTFGNGVRFEDTYSARLGALLADGLAPNAVEVVNAGVPAYTTFQSLQYLRTRGLALEPDWVLFYHEGNDFLPSYVRASDNTVIGMALSDAQRHADRRRSLHRRFLDRSAFYRFVQSRAALRRIDRFQRADDTGTERGAPWFARVGDESKPMRFPVRVPSADRARLLGELVGLSRERGFGLLLFHPSYRDSEPHECPLTRAAQADDVLFVEAHDLLHDPPLFLDAMHPTPQGHERLARAAAAAFGGALLPDR